MEFDYKKSLGQNFIYDIGFLRSIVKKINVQSKDYVVEVGAGAGTLTQALAETGCHVMTLEVDQRLQPILQERLQTFPNVKLILADALQYDFSKLPQFRLIANVPYYITTPLIMQFLALPNCGELNILVADEVAKRIVATVGTSLYGALSISCQLQAECKILTSVPKTMFTPQPKIDSAFICLKKNGQPADVRMAKLLKGVFAARRKTILNALSGSLNLAKDTAMKILNQVGIALTVRPEQITPTQYAIICALLPK